MSSRVVRVNDVGFPFARHSAELARRPEVPLAAQGEPIRREPRVLGSLDQWRAGWRDDQDAVAEIAEPGREKKNLALSTPPAAPGVDVKNPGQLH
jgi:hypothetical protein